MRYIIKTAAFTLALITGLMVHSQSVDIERGDDHLDIFEFEKAIEQYQKAYNYDTTNAVATRRIADAFRRKGDLAESAEWYEKTIELDQSRKEDFLYYAEALKVQKRYEESLVWYKKYNSIEPEDERADNHLENDSYYSDLESDSVSVTVKSLLINNKKPAFGVTKILDQIAFSASDMGSTTGKKTNPWNDLPYLDVYIGNVDESNEIVDVTPINEVNSKYNDGPAYYCEALSTMFITRNNMRRGKPVKDKTGSVNLKIYASKLDTNGWSEIYELPFNSNDYSTGHPCLTKDGKYMYFSCNKPEGEGGTDLYVSENINGEWAEPINLGQTVNTKGDEMFPYIDEYNTLYFSSTGHAGLGGLDLFKVSLDSIHTKQPVNVGYPLNSSSDDFSIMFEDPERSGYFCSNRDKGFSDNIYYFEINTLLNKILAGRIESSIPDKSLAGTELKVRNVETGEEESFILDDTGEFEFDGEPGVTYELAYQKEDVEEILATKTIEDHISLEYENLGVFTIHERMAVNVSDETGEIEINGVMYKRFQEDGSFISEKGDTLSNIEMMDMLARNLEQNDLEINDEVYKLDLETNTYVNEQGEPVPDEELEQMLISEIFANPMDAYDGSLLAGIKEPMLGSYADVNFNPESEDAELSSLSALDFVKNALEGQPLTDFELKNLELLNNTELDQIAAAEYLDNLTANPELSKYLSDIEKKALGIECSTPATENMNALEYMKSVLDEKKLTELDKIELEALESSSLAETSADDWLRVFTLDPEKVESLTGVEKKAAESLICDPEMSAANWLDLALRDESLTAKERIELENLKADGSLNTILAKDYIETYTNNPEGANALTAIEKKALGIETMDLDNSVMDYAYAPEKAATPDNSINLEEIKPISLENPEEYLIAADADLEEAMSSFDIQNVYFDFDKSYIRKDAQASLDQISSVLAANKDLNIYVNAHTDARGSDVYNHYLSEKRAAAVKGYLKARGINPERLELNWFGEKELANSCENGVSCDENDHQRNRRAMFKLAKTLNRTNDNLDVHSMASNAGKALEEVFQPFEADATEPLNLGLDDDELLGRAGLEVIYFDYNKSSIRRDASLILEVVSAAMKSNQKTLIINAHTDSRGKNAYNAQLSERRAMAAKNYLVKEGVSANRIQINWSGEEQLSNHCESTVICTPKEHQANRRATLVWK